VCCVVTPIDLPVPVQGINRRWSKKRGAEPGYSYLHGYSGRKCMYNTIIRTPICFRKIPWVKVCWMDKRQAWQRPNRHNHSTKNLT
jgi:hypothetical protein